MTSRFPIFLPESRTMAVKTVVGWAMRGADHVPARALRSLYFPGRGALQTARPRDHVEVFEGCRRELLVRSLVSRGLARAAAELLVDHHPTASGERWLKPAVDDRWSVDKIRTALGVENGLRALPSRDSENGLRASEAARDLKEAATRIRAILVSRTLQAMREVGRIVAALRDSAKVSYRALADETGLGISHTALRNAEKVAEQYDLLPPWVRDTLPYSHHVALLPVRDLATKRILACGAFRRNVPMPMREFQALVGETSTGTKQQLPPSSWLSSLNELIGPAPRWARVLGSLPETPSDELAHGVELVGDALDRLSELEERLSVELARRQSSE